MKSASSKSGVAAKRPPAFPALTSAQRNWVEARRHELKMAIEEGLASGRFEGYVAFDMSRILDFIERRQTRKAKKRKQRG